MPALCRAGAVGLLAAAALPLLVDETMTRWNLFAVLAPLVAVTASVLAWVVADGLRTRRLPLRYAGGLLLAVGVLTAAGSAGLVSFANEWLGSGEILLGGVAPLGAVAVRGGYLPVCVSHPANPTGSRGALDDGPRPPRDSASGGGAVHPVRRRQLLGVEVMEGTSATFAYLPVTAVPFLVVAVFLLGSRRELAAGMLTAAGVITAAHFVGAPLAASFAVGEVGEVRAAWVVGVAGGVLSGWPAGSPTRRTYRRPVDSPARRRRRSGRGTPRRRRHRNLTFSPATYEQSRQGLSPSAFKYGFKPLWTHIDQDQILDLFDRGSADESSTRPRSGSAVCSAPHWTRLRHVPPAG